MQKSLRGFQQEGVERQVAHLLRLEVLVDLLEALVSPDGRLQLAQDVLVVLDVRSVQLKGQGKVRKPYLDKFVHKYFPSV